MNLVGLHGRQPQGQPRRSYFFDSRRRRAKPVLVRWKQHRRDLSKSIRRFTATCWRRSGTYVTHCNRVQVRRNSRPERSDFHYAFVFEPEEIRSTRVGSSREGR